MRIPGPKWGAGRPPLETPKSRCATRIGRTPRRFAAGASVPLGKAASACALATAAAPPPLRVWGLTPPLPPRFGRRFLAPCVPQREKSADHARRRMGQRPKRLLQQRLRKSPGSSCREAARSSVTPLARLWPQATLARPQGGIPKGAQPSLASLCLLSAGQKVGARRGLSASKGKSKNLKEEGKEGKKPSSLRQKNQCLRPAECPAGVSASKGESEIFKERERG